MCESLVSPNSSIDEQVAFATLVAGELFAGQWGVNDRQRFNVASSSDPNNDASAAVSYPDGLHVDTNNEATCRSVTMILYLNDVDSVCGGATIFPLADAAAGDPAVVSAKALLRKQVTHTRGAVTAGGAVPASLQAAAAQLESLEALGEDDDAGGGFGGATAVLRIEPRKGRLCIFFSRTADGEIDPRAWHGGERLRPPLAARAPPVEGGGGVGLGVGVSGGAGVAVTEKRILTLFKEVHYGPGAEAWDGQQASLGAFLAPQVSRQRQYLEDLAKAHAPFFE